MIILLRCCFFLTAVAQSVSGVQEHIPELRSSLQLLIVTTSQWDSYQGTIRQFERPDPLSPWQKVGVAHPVVLGKKGLAWGM